VARKAAAAKPPPRKATRAKPARGKGNGATPNGEGELLRMGELAEASGVPAATIKHYLREGLLPGGQKTSRNMAYYPPDYVDRIRLIKQLQEERFMPLRVIREVLESDPDRARAMVEIEDRILERALANERTRTSATEVRERYDVPAEVLDRLEEIEVLSPNNRGYTPSDVRIIEAISRFRAGGYEEAIGFTVYDTLRYKRAMEELVREEVEVLMDRVAGSMEPDRAIKMIEAGAEPLKDLIAAMHTKVLIAELERQRSGG
jgi:DNA-binding transcriptional MerR regulator